MKSYLQYSLNLLWLIILMPVSDVFAQRLNIQVYSLVEGMPQSQVLSMIQDSRGYIWFGTYGGGACAFDGLDFIYFSTRNGLNNNSIWSIFEDSKGNIWFGTEDGVTKYDGLSFSNFNHTNGFSDSRVSSITEDDSGNILFGTSDGLIIYDGKEFLPGKTGDQTLDVNIFHIFRDMQGQLWMGTYDDGLYMLKGGSSFSITVDDGLTDNQINDIWQDTDSVIWVCTHSGISLIKNGEVIIDHFPDFIQSVNISSVMKDDQGNYWIATFGSGIYVYNGKNYRHITEDEGLSANMTYKCLQDNSGCIWISTDGGGVCKYTNDLFTYYSKQQGLGNNLVMSILEDHEHAMWFGSDGGGLFKLHDNIILGYKSLSEISSNRILALYEDFRDRIWIGTDGSGLYSFNGSSFAYDYRSKGMHANEIHTIYQSDDSILWIGTEDGIFRYQYDHFTRIQGETKGLDETCWAIIQDAKEVMWFATDLGILKYENGHFTNFSRRDGLVSNSVISLACNKGDLWIGTDNGLSCFDGNRFYNFTVNEGLSSGNIYLLIFDADTNLIVGTDKGFDKISFSKGRLIEKIKHYGYKEGFTGIECNANAVCKAQDGSIWFGTIKGVTRYNPEKEYKNLTIPKIRINDLQLFYETPDWSLYSDSIMPWCDMPAGLHLPHNKNHLTFHFNAISFLSPDKVRYRFILENFDQTWSPETPLKQVTYSNLPPGDYVFKVLACNGDGVWGKHPATYSFRIESPFWQSWWFLTSCIIAFLLMIYVYIRIHTYRLRAAKKALLEKVEERTKELNEKNIKLENLSIVARETDQGVLIADHEGKIQWMNHGLEKMTGYRFEDFKKIYGSTIQELSTHKDIHSILRHIEKSGESVQYDSMHVTRGGEQKWTTGTITPIFNKSGKMIKIVSVYTDITEKKRAQNLLQEKTKNITDSIQYAKKIQEAILPKEEVFYNTMPDSFILYKPRDIVSGDFFWYTRINDYFVVCAVDCTGHGVPGALMSMIGNELLHAVVKEKDITGPHLALHQLDVRLTRALHQTGAEEEAKDGMDLAMCAINLKKMSLQYAGAHRPVLIVHHGLVKELPPSRYSIGGYSRRKKDFKEHIVRLEKGDAVYLFSDGYTDQFGGAKGKKFLIKRLKTLLTELQDVPMKEQRNILWDEFIKWKGANRQVDDVLMMGFRVS